MLEPHLNRRNETECGPADVKVTESQMSWRVPPDGVQFTSGTECAFTFSTDAGFIVDFKVTKMDLGNDGGTCDEDFIRLADTPEGLGKNATVYCGTTPPKSDYTSTNNVVHIVIGSTTNPTESYVTGSYLIDASQSVVLFRKVVLLGIWLNWLNSRFT
ncbi:unnamed protein product [Echinostoma caproni]|uniref:CUB domain-containing protein n=1 Tax=Echinostoma caproni TaxID=27848 RepID=A0A183APL0_9TREM|nr:unnamed protein product [Echinostoma caproni]